MIVSADYVLPAGQELVDATATAVSLTETGWQRVSIDGRIDVSSPNSPIPLGGVDYPFNSQRFGDPREITVGPTGSILVNSTAVQQTAFGIGAGGPVAPPRVEVLIANFGKIEIHSAGFACGITETAGGVTNGGDIVIDAADSAVGVAIDLGGYFDNYGSIIVSGGNDKFDGVVGVRIFQHYEVKSCNNSGNIQAISLFGDVESVGVQIAGYARFENSGEIRADISMRLVRDLIAFEDGRSFELENTGKMYGHVLLNNYSKEPITIINSGLISGNITLNNGIDRVENFGIVQGDISFGTGADRYDGFEGTVTGIVRGEEGADTLVGGHGPETLSGGSGDDLITETGGTNYLRGDEGNDSIVGGSGFDDINGNQGNDTCVSGGGDDWVVGGKDNDSLVGSAGQNLVYGNLGNDTCEGGDGDDIVRGGQNDDIVNGGAGDDFVSGDKGNDTITGGAGADRFHTFGDAGIDRVLDFHISEGDRVQLDPGTQYTVSQVGADTVIDMTGGGQMILVGVQMSTLTGDWIFGA